MNKWPEGRRAFKTAWFSKAARKARISDQELSKAIKSAMQGKVDDLGGGVYKKRLNKNDHRAIILSKVNAIWVFEYVFAKKDRANIDDAELQAFRKLAKVYGNLTPKQIDELLKIKSWIELFEEDAT